jgi:hypothetical protein
MAKKSATYLKSKLIKDFYKLRLLPKDFDKTSYFSEFSKYRTVQYLLVCGIAYILIAIIFKLENGETFFSAIPRAFPQNNITNIVLLTFIVYSIFYVRKNIINKLYPTPVSLYTFSVTLFLYIFVVRRNSNIIFYSYQHWKLPSLFYTDLIFFAVSLLTLKYQVYQINLKKGTGDLFIEDNPDAINIKDEFNRDSYATKLCGYVLNMNSSTAFNIGVIAEWGAGKTDFLQRMKKTIQDANKVHDQNIIVEFNPWRAGKIDILIDDFFKTLSESLKPFNKSIALKLVDYSALLFKPGKEIQFRAIDLFLTELAGHTSIKSKFDQINASLQKTGKRLIIFIDDLDRLSGNEVFEVLKIIRNTASFSNTFFIVGLDEQYVVDALKKVNSVSRENQYLKKIFQLIVTLPVIRKNLFAIKIKEFLGTGKMPLIDQERIDRMLNFLDGPGGVLHKCFENLRDVKRFCNAFRISFDLLKEEVEINDIALLEILKAYNIAIYHEIANRNFLATSQIFGEYELDNAALEKYASKTNNDDITVVKLILEALIDKNRKGDRRFGAEKNFYLYFSYQLFSLIPLNEFNRVVQRSAKDIIKKFQEWESENKGVDLENVMDAYQIFSSKAELEKWLEVYVTMGGHYVDNIGKLMANMADNVLALFDKDETAYANYLSKFFSNTKIRSYNMAQFINIFLRRKIYGTGTGYYPFSKAELQTKILTLFEKYLINKSGYNIELERFYNLNDDDRGNDKILVYEASRVLEKYLDKSNENFNQFIQHLIRSTQIPNEDNQFTLNPYLNQIYPFLATFKKRLNKLQIKGQQKKLKEIILDNLDTETYDNKSFRLNETDKIIVIEGLVKLKLYPDYNRSQTNWLDLIPLSQIE